MSVTSPVRCKRIFIVHQGRLKILRIPPTRRALRT